MTIAETHGLLTSYTTLRPSYKTPVACDRTHTCIRGFARELKPERIIAATDSPGELPYVPHEMVCCYFYNCIYRTMHIQNTD